MWDIETHDTAAQAAAGEEAGGKAGWLEGADLGYVLVHAGASSKSIACARIWDACSLLYRVVKGAQIGAEVGQYQGFAQAVQDLALGNARAQAQAERLLSTTAHIVLEVRAARLWLPTS